ncbi:hypothetical protein DOTSEDRAFT_173598 [Dothistroma septosporum NZE10]|uniref:HPP transmembrane region domain-containing protein n=1 Tax=Dothistroma septosporum (strain NZE10 / CBS 128990) TaxID=675120 RepID=M2XKJ6_DOTSN|nr:hypothetical protein DOTSEDRAFT_173598 [Dothistroma septosporum NZE10]
MALPNDPKPLYQLLDFDIDRYINPWIPHNRLHYLPTAVSRWLGYRPAPVKEPYAIFQWPVTFLATVASLCLLGGLGSYAPGLVGWHPPVIVASLGASAVLDFNAIKSPLAQPRNAILGNTLAAICGVAVAKGFEHYSSFDQAYPHNIQWVAGAVGCALASLVMSLTNTIHPPGGATAVLASTQTQIIAMGWRFVPIILLDSTLMMVVALIFNNVLRQYPMYWWTASDTGSKLRQQRREARGETETQVDEDHMEKGKARSDSDASSDTDRTLRRELSNPLASVEFVDGMEDVHITPYKIQMPHHLKLEDDEVLFIERIQERLRMHGEIDPRRTS